METTTEQTGIMGQDFPWAIIEDGGVSDRFATRDEALAEIKSYGSDATIEYFPVGY